MTSKTNIFGHLKSDFASGLVVFLVALPLCLGIALTSGAPLFSGIISGIIGGVVVGYLSKSHVSVTGPAAGLTAIVLASITELGAFNIFLTAVILAGLLQLLLGFFKAGSISNYFPNNVIEGMLVGIGIIIFVKQIPHAVGYDKISEGDTSFVQKDGSNMFETFLDSFNYISYGSIIITIVSLFILIVWDKIPFLKRLKLLPAALFAVIIGIVLNEFFIRTNSALQIKEGHLVTLPTPSNVDDFKAMFVLPNFSLEVFTNTKVWIIACTIAVVASIETLLCIEASDRMDRHKRYTNTNVELKAQGIGNVLSGLIGGLPMTSVVVRSSANVNAGAETKMSTIIHGLLLMISVLTISPILNKIPLATLAAILLLIGYKLAKPKIFKHFYQKGIYQFIPFIATVLAVVFLDLLKGVTLGLIISIFFVMRGNFKRAYLFKKEEYNNGDVIYIQLAQEVSFLNKAAIKNTLKKIPANSTVEIDASDTVYIAHDVLDLIKEFQAIKAIENNIIVRLVGFKKAYNIENTDGQHVIVKENKVE